MHDSLDHFIRDGVDVFDAATIATQGTLIQTTLGTLLGHLIDGLNGGGEHTCDGGAIPT